jgi:pseudomonalisin
MPKHDRSFFNIRKAWLVFSFALMAATLSQSPALHAQSSWSNISTHAYPIGRAVYRAYLAPNEPLDIVVALKLRNRDKLDALVKTLMKPGNPSSKHWLSTQQIQNDYAPSSENAQAVADYLTKTGFTNVRIEPGRLLVTATGTAAVVRKAFKTELAHFIRDGHEGIANVKDVRVPSALSDSVLSVLGLQTLDQMHPMSQQAASVQLTGSVHGINPVNFPKAYHAADLPTASTIAVGIITEGVMTQTITDLHTFETNNNQPTINPTVVNAWTTGSTRDTSGTVEWDLDSQDIQAMAGGASGADGFLYREIIH